MNRRAACLLAAVLFAYGCAGLDLRRPSITEPWCYPKGKWDRERHAAYLGISCRY